MPTVHPFWVSLRVINGSAGSGYAEREPIAATGKRKADAVDHETPPPRAYTYTPPSHSRVEFLSSYRLVKQMFGGQGIQAGNIHLAGCTPGTTFTSPSYSDKFTICEILGNDLPELPVITILVDSYVRAVQWYIPLIHEPTFRSRLAALVMANECLPSDRSFLMLGLIVILIGLHFLSAGELAQLASQVDVYSLRRSFEASMERKFLESIHQYNRDWVSFTMLLSMYYMIIQQPRRASALMGSAVRAALDMLTVDEATFSTLEREMRKRVAWTVYIGDGFTALVGNSIPMFKAEDISTTEPLDLEDNSAKSLEFTSYELREDGSLQPVTIYSFHRYRAKLYRIASQLHVRNRQPQQVADPHRIREISDQLDQLRADLPPELCLNSYSYSGHGGKLDQTGRTFRLQALTLRVLCEHIQLLLLKPFIPHQHSTAVYTPESREAMGSIERHTDTPDMMSLSWTRSFECAKRVADIDEHPDILQMTTATPLQTHLRVVSFTSGVVLGMLALSRPMSNDARDCKIELARIVNLPSLSSSRDQLWSQATDILKDILRFIGSEETKALLIGNFPWSPEASSLATSNNTVDSVDGAENDTFPGCEIFPYDGGVLSEIAMDLTSFDALADCCIGFPDFYGPSIGLGEPTQDGAIFRHGMRMLDGFDTSNTSYQGERRTQLASGPKPTSAESRSRWM